MVNKIKQWFEVRKANKLLVLALNDALAKNNELREEMAKPETYVKLILSRDIGWFDASKLDQGTKLTYFLDAQNILGNQTFNNEIDHYISDLIKFCATMEGIHPDHKLTALTNVQASIVALETFRNRFKQIENPTKNAQDADPFETI